MDRLLLKPEEAAEVLGIGRSKVYELMRGGALASVQIGACRRIPTDAIRRYIASLTESAGALA